MVPSKPNRIEAIFENRIVVTAEALQELTKWEGWAIDLIMAQLTLTELEVLAANPWLRPQANDIKTLLRLRERNIAGLANFDLPKGLRYYETQSDINAAKASGELVPLPNDMPASFGVYVPEWILAELNELFAQLAVMRIQHCWTVRSGARSLAEQSLLAKLGFPATARGANNLRGANVGGINLAINDLYYHKEFLPGLSEDKLYLFAGLGIPYTLENLRQHKVISDTSTEAKVVDALVEFAHNVGFEIFELTDFFSRDERRNFVRVNPVVQLRRTV